MRRSSGLSIIALALALALASCGQPGGANQSMPAGEAGQGFAGAAAREESAAADAAAPPAAAPAPQAPNQSPIEQAPTPQQGEQTAQPTSPSPVLYLAYSFFVALDLPADRLAGVMDAHTEACVTAGARLCQLVGSTRSGDPESFMQGELHIRAEPTWLRAFRSRLAADADSAGGRIREQSTNTEDLTRQIVDTEARLRASRALRDRLQRLLESRPGRLSDLLEVERELARVQGEIDATESGLAVMRTRVAMSELTLRYQSQPQAVGSNTFEPLSNAFANFLSIIVQGLAAIVTAIAALLPAAVIIALVVWGVLAWRKRRGGKLIGPAPPPDANL